MVQRVIGYGEVMNDFGTGTGTKLIRSPLAHIFRK